MVILGIDPGIQITGYGLLEVHQGVKPALIEAGFVRTKPKNTSEKRLLEIYNGLSEVVEEFKPSVMAIEELYSHYSHPKTAITMGHARGVAFLIAAQYDISVVSYSANRIKNAVTGYGKATKIQVQEMIRQTLGLKETPKPADAADALAVALCHAYALSHGVDGDFS